MKKDETKFKIATYTNDVIYWKYVREKSGIFIGILLEKFHDAIVRVNHRIENLHEEYVPSLVSNIEEIYFVKLIEIRGNKRKKLVFEGEYFKILS